MIAKVLVVAALVCGVIAVFVSKGAFGVEAVQFAGAGVVLLAVAALL
jgi:hypothetical protein